VAARVLLVAAATGTSSFCLIPRRAVLIARPFCFWRNMADGTCNTWHACEKADSGR
jgi:hypothetical protein